MSEDDGSHHVRQTPRKRNQTTRIADFTTLVRVPGQPAAAQVFTDAEQDEARRYAAQTGGTVVPLPLSPPSGYATDASGNLVPQTDSTPSTAHVRDSESSQ